MLKKKALTAILTVAMVFGVGGMVTEPVSTHEHSHIFESAVAHAAPDYHSIWRCYWCGKVLRSESGHFVGPNEVFESREPRTLEEKCPHKHEQSGGRHGWVWVSGYPHVKDYKTYYYCRRCNEVSGLRINGDVPIHHKLCPANNGGSHDWAPTGIVKTR